MDLFCNNCVAVLFFQLEDVLTDVFEDVDVGLRLVFRQSFVMLGESYRLHSSGEKMEKALSCLMHK